MKNVLKATAVILFTLSIIIFNSRCNKAKVENPPDSKPSDALLQKAKAFQEEQMGKGITVFTRKYSEGEITARGKSIATGSQRVNADCIGDLILEVTSVTAQYKNGSCSTIGDYYMSFSFAIKHVGITFNNASTLPITIKYTIGGVDYSKSLTIQNLKESRTVVNITTAPVIVNEYCSIGSLSFEVNPNVTCPDGLNYSGTISASLNIFSDRSDICKNISPVFIEPNVSGPGSVGLNGYFLCGNSQFNPCFALAEKMEFQYRLVGASSWNTYTLNPYLDNAYSLNNISAGDYEFMWRNIKVTSPICTGPFSDIIVVTIN